MTKTRGPAPARRPASAALKVGRLRCWLLIAFVGCMWGQSAVAAASNGAAALAFSLRVTSPRGETTSTTREVVHVLGRTSPDATVTVGGEAAQVFATGVFVRDNVPLQMGENRITVVASSRGQTLERVLVVTRRAETPAPPEPEERRLAIDEDSLEPAQDVILSRGDILELSFRGTPGQKAEYALSANDWQPMTEALEGPSAAPSGLYRACLAATADADTTNSPVHFRLQTDPSGKSNLKVTGGPTVEATTQAKAGFWGGAKLRLVRVAEDGASLSFGLHEVRLGGPYLTDLPAGTLLRVTGMRGGNYHVQLSPDMDGWISRRSVSWAPAGTPLPHLAFTDLSAYGNDSVDLVGVPYTAPVPFAVTPTRSPAGRAALEIDFYGAHNAATWLSHRPTAKVIREVTVNQVAADHLRLCVELKGQQLWGYQCDVTNHAFVLTIRRPPQLPAVPGSSLKGLIVALEAGHGGNNTGAGGISGSQEKDVNRGAVEELARQFEAAGAKTVIVRKGDESTALSARVRRGIAANAALWISIHANSAGHERGYLSVSGTSTYYKWPFCRDFADAIHTRLLDMTRLFDFGNVGNFNYYPLRANTWMPSMLVEQAFMSNPEDEAKMLDPVFRQQMMHAVVLGTEDWLNHVRSQPGE